MKEISVALMLEATNVGILCADREGRILFANAAAGKILGRERGGVIGRFIGDITLEAWTAFQRIMETGVPQDGVKIQTDASTLIADRNPVRDGKEIVGVVSVFKEISRYEDTAKELQTYKELAKQLDVVIRSSYDGLYITDGNANTLLFNKAYLRISGLKAEDLEGKNVPGSDGPRDDQPLVDAGGHGEAETRHRDAGIPEREDRDRHGHPGVR